VPEAEEFLKRQKRVLGEEAWPYSFDAQGHLL